MFKRAFQSNSIDSQKPQEEFKCDENFRAFYRRGGWGWFLMKTENRSFLLNKLWEWCREKKGKEKMVVRRHATSEATKALVETTHSKELTNNSIKLNNTYDHHHHNNNIDTVKIKLRKGEKGRLMPKTMHNNKKNIIGICDCVSREKINK